MAEKMVITKIEKQKKSKNRLSVYINDEYAFSIHEDIYVKNRLYKGMVIDDSKIEELLYEEEKNKVWNKALRYLSYRPRTKLEVKNYLIDQEYEVEIIDSVIENLIRDKYLDDSLYAEQFIQQRMASNPKGKKFIAYELKNKGISSADIDNAIKKIDENMEYEMAINLADKRFAKYKNLEWQDVKIKLGGYLQRKGFSYDTIYKVFSYYQDKLNKD